MNEQKIRQLSLKIASEFLFRSSDVKEKIKEFLKKNPNPEDKQIHELAHSLGIDEKEFEETIYGMLSKRLKGQTSKDAIDFTSISPLVTRAKFSPRELARALRLSISAEHDAAHLYELIADSTDDKEVKKVMQDVSNEEKVHVGEFKALLNRVDKSNKDLETEGKEEIKEID